MANEWGPLTFQTTTRPTRSYDWPTGSVIPRDVDDQAPIPLIVGIALALFIGFVIIVFCICRRHNLLGGSPSSSPQDNLMYQRAPNAEGIPAGGNSYPMAPVKTMFLPPTSGQPTITGLPNKTMAGGGNMGQHIQSPQPPYPSIPPDAYTPPYPLGYAPLPSYMPTSPSSHTSSASGPSSDQGPSGGSSVPVSGPPGLSMIPGNMNQSADTPDMATTPRMPGSGDNAEGGKEYWNVSTSAGGQGLNQQGTVYTGQSHFGPGSQGHYGLGGQGSASPGMGPGGFQMAMANQRMMMGTSESQGSGYGTYGTDSGGQSMHGPYPPTTRPTAMDYVPAGAFIPRVGSPMPPPGTTMTELDQL